MIELKPPTFSSNAVHSIGWEPIKSGMRGNIHVQWHKDGQITQRGYYKACQVALFRGLEASTKPGKFIQDNLKETFDTDGKRFSGFEWVRLDVVDPLLEEEMRSNLDLDLSLPDVVIYPASLLSTAPVEEFQKCLDAQRIPREGLFT
jgi:hypothetical protein